jgi:YegS/Rv2252/BmrU family lipid kinase
MMRYGLRVPLAVFPEGTSNDLAKYLGIPSAMDAYISLLTEGALLPVDLGRVADRYFVNVASAGAITETVHEVGYSWKNTFGRLAYYVKGVEKLSRLQKLRMKLLADGEAYEEDIYFFMILNGGVSGGFRHIRAPNALSDGIFDFIAVRPQQLQKLLYLILQMTGGNYLTDVPGVFYRQARTFEIALEQTTESDLDGEPGPKLPWTVELVPRAIELRAPRPAPG